MKRIVALFSAVLMVLFALPIMVRAEENTTLTLTADKTVANPGDRVTFSLTLGAVNNLGGMSFYIDIPEGLSIDYDSVALPEGVLETLDVDGEISVPTKLNENIFDYSAKKTGYTATSDLCILTFVCTVDSDSALETKSVGLKEGVDVFDNTPMLNTIQTTVNAAQLKIEEAKVPVATPTPVPTATPTPVPTAVPTARPTAVPTPVPTAVPTARPTAVPTPVPTAVPTARPTAVPTPVPTAAPTAQPTAVPTPAPTSTPEVTPYYLENLEDLIEEVETGATISISKKDGIISLNRNILKRLNECGVSLEMEYTYEGKDYKIFIPAGKAVIDDDVFWCGPLYLAGMYGNNSTGIGALAQTAQGIGQTLKQIVELAP